MTKEPDSKTPSGTDAKSLPTESLPTDAEIEATAERLGTNWLKGPTRTTAGASSFHQIVQNLPLGRAHAVSVEVKRPPKRRA
jgi:hypothetical protein